MLRLCSPGSGGSRCVTQCSVSCISGGQASLERKVFGQIVFDARVGKEAVDKAGRSSVPPTEQTHSCHWEGSYTLSPNLSFQSRMTSLLDRLFWGGLALRASQNKAKHILFLELIFFKFVITYLHPSLI